MYAEFLKFDKNAFPGWNGEFAKLYADFDPAKATEQFMSAMKDAPVKGFDFTGFDFNVVLDAQRKNMEAVNKAGQAALEGAQAIAAKQAEIFKQSVDQATTAAESFGKADTPEAIIAKQADLYKKAFETAVANSQKVAQMMTKANETAQKAITARIAESFDEVKGQVKKSK